MALEIAEHGWVFARPSARSPAPAFTHTPLHDLEPLLWMVVWSLVQQPIGSAKTITDEQAKKYRSIFRFDVQTNEVNGKRVLLVDADAAVAELFESIVEDYPTLEALEMPVVQLVQAIKQAHTNIHNKGKLEARVYSDGQAPLRIARCFKTLRLPDTEDVALGRRAKHVRTAAAALGEDKGPNKKPRLE
jgi:hypothetical protein